VAALVHCTVHAVVREFFFFQAEDGIRDRTVTGVQTCALPIFSGNILGRTQTATLYVHDGIESFNTEGAYAASVLLAGVSFVMLKIGRASCRERVQNWAVVAS